MIEAQNTETNELKPWEMFGKTEQPENELKPWEMFAKTEQMENELKPWEMFAKAKESNFYAPRAFERERLYKAFAGDPLAVLDDNLRPEMEFYANREANPDEMRKRVALAAYFSMMDKKKFSFALENLDGFLDRYYAYTGKKMDVNGAYEDISGMLATAGKIAPAEQDGSKTGSLLKGSFSQLLGTVYNLGTTLLEGAVQYENVQRNLDGMGTRADEIHKDFNGVRDVTAGYYKDIAEKERAKLIDPDWATLEGVQRNGVAGTMKNLTLSVLFEAPNMAAQAAVGAVNPALVPVMMGVTTAADKAYDLERENSDMNEIQQMANIIGTGLVNGYLEKVTMGIFKGSGLKLEPETLKAGMKEAFKYYLKSMGKEGLEESAEQLAENAVDIATGRYGYGETTEERLQIVKEHLFEGVIESGVVGGAYGAPFAGVGHRNLRRADESKNRALNMLRTREAELKAKSDLTEIETAELRHIQTTLESGNLNETLGLAQDVAVEQEAKRRADAEAAVERDAEMTSEERAEAARQDYQLRRSMAHNPEDTADAVAETGAGYKVNVRACGTAEIASMETGRNAEEIRAFYDPETDTVVVNTDRVRPSEVPYLFLHEVAVHKGLDAVFGESRKNAVLDGLYGQVHEQVEALNTGYGFDLDTTEGRRAATEEYLAECAEFCGHDWRKFDRENEEDVTRWLAEHNMALMRRKEGVRGVLEERGELSVRPAWWREFLQKVKMFFYGFKGFSNYRFTDKEIETLLLRGYRKTRSARGAKAEGGDARFAALRREGAPNTAEESGQMRDSHVPHEEGFMEKYKFSGKGLYADYEFLYGRHPEYFEDAEHVRAAVEFVLAQPEEAVDVEGNAAFVRRDEETGTPYRIEIEKTTRAKYNHIRSVHVLSEQQYEKAKAGATPANAASPVLQPSQNRVRQTDTNGDLTGRQGRTVSDFLRYDSTESGKVKHALEDGSDFSDGADRYTLENAKASKEGYRVERVNENAGRDLTEAQGVVCEVNQVFNPEEAARNKGNFFGWATKKLIAYEKAHPMRGSYYTPALGNSVEIAKSSLKSLGNHPGENAKFNLLPAVPDMLKNAVLIQSEANVDKNTQSIRSYSHLLAAKVRYGKDDRYVAIMVIREGNGKLYYDHSLLILKEESLGREMAAENGNPAQTAGSSSHTAQVLKVAREALLSSGFDTKSEKNLRFSIEQYSDADWSDMVTYMRSKVGDVLNHPDSDYRRMLEEAGMRCYSDADAHACAAEAMQQNEREIRERGKQRRDKWIYENELLYRLVVDFAGSDKFTLVPDSFTGEKFTGTWIAEEYRKYSEKRAQKPTESDKQYKRYLQTREKALARAKGYRLDEVAEAIARKTGRDTLEVQEELVDYFRDLKKPDLYHRYSEWRQNHEFDSSRLTNDLEEYEELQYAMAEEAIIALIEEKHEVTPGWISANRKAYNLLYKRVFGKDAPRGKAGAKDIADLNAALAQEKGDMAAFAAGIKEGRAQLSGEYLKKLGAFKKMIVEDWRNIRDVQYAAKKFAYENVDEGFRDKFISGIIRLSRFSAKGSKAYPDGRRAYEFDRLCEAMVSYQREVTKEKAIREIREMLDANRTKRTDKNVPYSPMRERQTALDRIAQIVRMDAETVQECQRYAGERISKAQEALEKLPEEAAEGADGKTELEAEAESAQREIWYLNHFGALGLKDAEFVEKSRKMLKEFIKTGREEFRAEMLARREEVESLRSAAIREMSGGDETIPSNRDLERKADGVSDYLMKSVSLPRLLDWISRSGNEFELEKSVAGKMLNLVEDSTRREKRRMNEMQSWFDRTLKDECGVKGIVEKGRFLNGALKEEDTGVPLVQYGTVLGEKDHKVAHWDMGRAKRTDGMRVEHCRKMLEDLKNGKEVTGYIGIHDVELSKSVRSGLKESGVKTGRFYSVCTTKEGFRIYTENESGETIGLDLRRDDAPAELKGLQEDKRNVLEISDITREGAKRQIQEYDAGATAAGRKALGDEIDEAAWKAFEEGRGRDQRVMLIAPGENVCSRVENLKTSPGGAMQLILNWEQPDYRAGMEWNGYTEETIGKLKDWLNGKNEGYLKLAYAMRDYLKREHAELDAAVYKRYGVHMPSTENFFYGDFSGSVASRISDPGYGNPSGGMTVSASFLTARRFHLIAPDVHGNAIGLFMRKQLEQNHFICWTETVRELRSVYGDRGVQNVLVREFGQAMWNNLREKIELLASNGSSPDKAAKYLNYFFKSWAPANVALNMSSILKQFAGGTSYSLYIPQSALLRYLPEANWGNRDYRAWLERPEVKEFIADRMQGGLDPNYGGMMNYTRRGGKVHSVTEAGIKALMFPNLYSDKLTALTFGYAVYRYYYEQARKKTKRNAVADGSVAERETSIGEAEKFALRMWMRATDETQQSGALKDMNHFTASPGAWRYLTTFMTNPMQTAALELTAWRKWMKDRTKENRNVLIRRIVVNHLVNTTLMNLVASVFRHGLNIGDYLDDWDDYVAGWLLGSFDSLWLFGKEAMMIKEGLAGNRYAGDMSAVPMLSELAKDAGTMRKIAEGKDVDFLEWMKMTGDVLMSAGPGLTRLPGILLYSLARQGLRVKRMFTEKK